jgi:hypothetical protein
MGTRNPEATVSDRVQQYSLVSQGESAGADAALWQMKNA